MDRTTTHRLAGVALTFAGPAALGTLIGAQESAADAGRLALGVPAIVIGLTALLVPALYVGSALTGGAPPARAMLRMTARAVWSCGVVLVGLAAPIGFLLFTSQSRWLMVMLGTAALALAALAALRGFAAALFAREQDAPAPRWLTVPHGVFAAWAITGLIVGARLFHDLLAGVGQ